MKPLLALSLIARLPVAMLSIGLLVHTGYFSVQLRPPGQMTPADSNGA